MKLTRASLLVALSACLSVFAASSSHALSQQSHPILELADDGTAIGPFPKGPGGKPPVGGGSKGNLPGGGKGGLPGGSKGELPGDGKVKVPGGDIPSDRGHKPLDSPALPNLGGQRDTEFGNGWLSALTPIERKFATSHSEPERESFALCRAMVTGKLGPDIKLLDSRHRTYVRFLAGELAKQATMEQGLIQEKPADNGFLSSRQFDDLRSALFRSVQQLELGDLYMYRGALLGAPAPHQRVILVSLLVRSNFLAEARRMTVATPAEISRLVGEKPRLGGVRSALEAALHDKALVVGASRPKDYEGLVPDKPARTATEPTPEQREELIAAAREASNLGGLSHKGITGWNGAPGTHHSDDRLAQALPRIALVGDGPCLAGWRGELSVPFGEFVAVVRGEFAQDGNFYASEVASNQAALEQLERLSERNARVITFSGCGTKFQTVQTGRPVKATVLPMSDNWRCRERHSKWVPSKVSAICVASGAGYRGYKVSAVN